MSAIAVLVASRMLASIACAVAAGFIAYSGKEGWGWFLFAAVWLGAITVSTKSDGSGEVEE